MNDFPEPSDPPQPYLSQESQLGATLLTEIAAGDRPLMQADLAQRLLERLPEWPVEPTLLYSSADGTTTVAVPVGEQITVGRLPGKAQVVVPVAHMSNPHFQITRAGSVHRLVDLKSRNGTFVNGKRWDEFLRLERGDCIQAGGVNFVFWKRGF